MDPVNPIFQELAAKMKRPNSKALPEFLQRLATLEQAQIVRELPASPEEIAKKLGLDPERVEKNLKELFDINENPCPVEVSKHVI